MNHVCSFTVAGEPTGKARARVTTRGGYARAYTPAATRNAEELVKEAARAAMADRPPITSGAVTVLVLVHRLKGIPGQASARPGTKARRLRDAAMMCQIFPTSKPDVDNYLKLVLDACNGIVYDDDSRVVDTRVRKIWSEAPCLEIYISHIPLPEGME